MKLFKIRQILLFFLFSAVQYCLTKKISQLLPVPKRDYRKNLRKKILLPFF